MRRIIGILLAVLAPVGALAQPALRDVYDLQDQKMLQQIVREHEAVLARDPNSVDSLKVLGIAYHNLGRQKVSGSVGKALARLERAAELAPNDQEIRVYLGSAKTMEARDSWNPITKTLSVRKGMGWIDDAVEKDPDNVTVRLVRAHNSLELPRMFNRVRHAQGDLLHLQALAEKNPKAFDLPLHAEIFFLLGEVSEIGRDDAKARAYWQKAVEAAPESDYGHKAKARL
jgi:tetratricopeptide (TPR) repeat protein